jgi:hypothetical protein
VVISLFLTMSHFLQADNVMCHWSRYNNTGIIFSKHDIKLLVISRTKSR